MKKGCIFALPTFKGLSGAVKQLTSKFAYQLAKIRAQRYVGKNLSIKKLTRGV